MFWVVSDEAIHFPSTEQCLLLLVNHRMGDFLFSKMGPMVFHFVLIVSSMASGETPLGRCACLDNDSVVFVDISGVF